PPRVAFTKRLRFQLPNSDSAAGVGVSKALPDDAKLNAPEKGAGQRSIMALVALFLLAFAFATGVQVKAHHDSVVRQLTSAQTAHAARLAARVNANLAAAMGAAAGASELARTSSVLALDPQALANAAAHAYGVRAAAVLDANGAVIAITDRSDS